MNRSRSQTRQLSASPLAQSVAQLNHAKSLRGLARKSGSRAMISNSYRILDQKRVSNEGSHRPYPAPEEPSIKLPPTGANRHGRAPVSVSLNLHGKMPKNRFLTVNDEEEGKVTGEIISLEFGRLEQSKSPSPDHSCSTFIGKQNAPGDVLQGQRSVTSNRNGPTTTRL